MCRAFGFSVDDAEPLRGGHAWRCGEVVLEGAHERSYAVWLASTMTALDEAVDPAELRVARPVRSSDGRWVVGGWRARRHLSGAPDERGEQSVLTAVRLHQAMATLRRPEPPSVPDAVFATAERLAWGERYQALDESRGGRLFEILALACRPTALPPGLVHGALFGALLFDDAGPPGLVDFVPCWRPVEWGVALTAVDALVAGADSELLRRWAHLPEWPQLLLRAVLCRLAEHALDPYSPASRLDDLRRAAKEVTQLL